MRTEAPAALTSTPLTAGGARHITEPLRYTLDLPKPSRALGLHRMAWLCLLSVIILTVLLVSPLVAETRVSALSDLVGLFYISMAGVIGAHMGVQAWMSKR